MSNTINGSISGFSSIEIGHIPPLDLGAHLTNLFWAVRRGDLLEVKRILSLGIIPNIQHTSDAALLQGALQEALGHFTNVHNPLSAITAKAYSIVQLLIAAGVPCTLPIGAHYLNIFDYALSTRNFGLLVTLHEYYYPQIQISISAWENFFRGGDDTVEFISKYHYYSCMKHQIAKMAMVSDVNVVPWRRVYERILKLQPSPQTAHPYLLMSTPEMTQKYLDLGVKINVQDEAGYTALHHLARNVGNISCLPLLLSHGADLFLPAKDGATPLLFACLHKQSKFLQMLGKHEASKKVSRPSLHTAILANDFPRIKKELESFDLDTRDIFGDTAFQTALRFSSLLAVQILSPLCADKEALVFAAVNSSVEIVSFLITQIEVDEETLTEMLEDTTNTEVEQWIREHYALEYPALLISGNSDSERIVSLATLEACVQKILPSQDLHYIIGALLFRSLVQKRYPEAFFLLEVAKDRSFFKKEDLECFYSVLFDDTNEEFVEKAIKKFGISELEVGNIELVSFCKKYPHLFAQWAYEIFERLFAALEKDMFFVPIIPLAVCIGEAYLVERALKKIMPQWNLYNSHIHEVFVLSLEIGNENVSNTIVKVCKENQKTIDERIIYKTILQVIPEAVRKGVLFRMLKLHKIEAALQECEEMADMLIALQAFPSALDIIIDCIRQKDLFSDVKRIYRFLSKFVQKVSLLSVLPCSNLSSKGTVEWLTGMIYSCGYCQNPQLFLDDALVDTICDILISIRSPEDYGQLLEALKNAPNLVTLRIREPF